MSYGRGSGARGPRSTRHLLGASHRGGGKPPKGCRFLVLVVFALAPTLAGLAGWAGGAAFGWWTT